MSETYTYLFGPVPSRRLGLSLGVDLVPSKTCSLDCVYCESGKTTHLTVLRKPWVDVDKVTDELERFLSQNPGLDVVTFSGSGEPVLNTSMPEIVTFLKTRFPAYRTALLTNGTLFYMEQARRNVLEIDRIIASLDAVSPDVFRKVNRPHPDLDPERIIQGLIDLRKEYRHELWIEIFIVPGLNDTDRELDLLSSAVRRIAPDRVQINTLDRPGTEPWVKRAEKSELERIQGHFDRLEIIGLESCRGMVLGVEEKALEPAILQLVRRRPCTPDDMVKSLGLDRARIDAALARLMTDGKIQCEAMERGLFFRIP